MGSYPSTPPYVKHFESSRLIEKNGYFYWEILCRC